MVFKNKTAVTRILRSDIAEIEGKTPVTRSLPEARLFGKVGLLNLTRIDCHQKC